MSRNYDTGGIMHILHIETGMNLYGGALQVAYLLRGLAAHQCRNTLVGPENSMIAKAVRPNAKVYAVPMIGDLDLRFGWRLLQIVRSEKPDLIHVHSRRGADLWGALTAIKSKIPAIVTRRVDNPENPFMAKLKYRCYRRVITISKGIQKVLMTEGIPGRKITCVLSAVDNNRFKPGCKTEWFRNEFRLSNNTRVIGTIAQLIERKGHRHLIDAAPAILEQFPQTRFLFLGKGPLEEELQRTCKSIKISDKVIFAGFREDIERIIPCLDLVVHPAEMEGLGVSLLQSAACGVPIIASKAGGLPEIVHDNENGYLIEPGDSNAIAEKSIALLEDTAKARRFGKAGIKIIQENFSIDSMVEGNLKVYREILNIQSEK